MIVLGIIFPILVFFVFMNITYAFFTSTVKSSNDSTSSAILLINLSNESATVTTTASVLEEKLLPGSTLTHSLQISNNGNVSFYAIIKMTIKLKKSTEESYSIIDSILTTYDFGENEFIETTLEDLLDESKTTKTAFLLESNQNLDFTYSLTFDGNTYNNDYKKANILYEFEIYAIQTIGFSRQTATNYLCNNYLI